MPLTWSVFRWVGNNLSGIAAMGTFLVVIVGQIRHRKHEATSDANHKQGMANAKGIAEIRLVLNGGLQEQIEEAVERHVEERLK